MRRTSSDRSADSRTLDPTPGRGATVSAPSKPAAGWLAGARAGGGTCSLRALALATILFLPSCNSGQSNKAGTAKNQEAAAAQARVEQSTTERGKYLVAVAGCSACHTPMKMGASGPEPDLTRFLAGHPQELKLSAPPAASASWTWSGSATNTAFAGPWGVSYATNLTSDQETGLGAWTDQVFINALKTGRHMGVGRPILPPMPWTGYAQMSDDDLRAVFTYLRTVDAKSNQVPEPSLAAPAPPAPAAAKPGSAPAPTKPAPDR
jgi:mono/diheme cytochrome c family protein